MEENSTKYKMELPNPPAFTSTDDPRQGYSGQRLHQGRTEHPAGLCAQPQLPLAVAAPRVQLSPGGQHSAVVHSAGNARNLEIQKKTSLNPIFIQISLTSLITIKNIVIIIFKNKTKTQSFV